MAYIMRSCELDGMNSVKRTTGPETDYPEHSCTRLFVQGCLSLCWTCLYASLRAFPPCLWLRWFLSEKPTRNQGDRRPFKTMDATTPSPKYWTKQAVNRAFSQPRHLLIVQPRLYPTMQSTFCTDRETD